MKPITIQDCASEPVETFDLYIPIYRMRGSNAWFCLSVFDTKADAIACSQVLPGVADVKILHHVERLVKNTDLELTQVE